MNAPLLVTNVTLFTDPDTPLLGNHWLLTHGNTIHSFGPMDTVPQEDEAILIDGEGKLLMPGLINGHNHCAMTLFRGLADDLELGAWLNDHIFPAEATHVNPEMVYWCSKLAAAEMILSGTTTVADGYFYEEQTAQALLDAGMRAIPAQGIIDFPAPGVPEPRNNIIAAEAFLSAWQGRDERIRPGIFAHSPYTCSPETLLQAKNLTRKYKVPFFIHAAESRQEPELLMDPQGTSPIRHLAALDLLDEDTILIHCVWLDKEDKKIIRESGAGVVVCPQSNFKLASGIAQVSEMESLGIPVGLGTDGSASNNRLDLFQEMDILAKGQKMQALEATIMPARKALAAATTVNAHILGLSRLGRIVPGFIADLILLDLNQPHLQPCYNGALLVYSANGADVIDVIINGNIVLRDRKILSFDLQETMQHVRRLASGLNASPFESKSTKE
jgi:5-methylthioadenosine/S-adenosylhomocysteine deaminase